MRNAPTVLALLILTLALCGCQSQRLAASDCGCESASKPVPRFAPLAALGGLSSCGRMSLHVRAMGGPLFFLGDDEPESGSQWGVDGGLNFRGTCFGADVFYRRSSSQSPRLNPGGSRGLDGGDIHHVGLKATYERGLRNSRWFVWAGIGPEYFWTDSYLDNDEGFGVFGEAGIGLELSRNMRLRAGVNLHGLSTDIGRFNAANDGSARWLWLIVPMLGAEWTF